MFNGGAGDQITGECLSSQLFAFINTAMIFGSLLLSVIIALRGISLLKALVRDGMREKANKVG